MSTTHVRRNDMKFEIAVIPVSDVDRAKDFYTQLGWRLDAEFAAGDGSPDGCSSDLPPTRLADGLRAVPLSGGQGGSAASRSEERRGGNEWGFVGRSRGAPDQ